MLVCDFCAVGGARWAFPCRPFENYLLTGGVLPVVCLASEEGWAACDTCAALITADESAKLWQRANQSRLALGGSSVDPATDAVLEAMLTLLLAAFERHRDGPPVRLGAGEIGDGASS